MSAENLEIDIVSEHYFCAADGIVGKAMGSSTYMSCHPVGLQDPVIFDKYHPFRMLTFCVLVLKNGSVASGESVCLYPKNFDAKASRIAAKASALSKLCSSNLVVADENATKKEDWSGLGKEANRPNGFINDLCLSNLK